MQLFYYYECREKNVKFIQKFIEVSNLKIPTTPTHSNTNTWKMREESLQKVCCWKNLQKPKAASKCRFQLGSQRRKNCKKDSTFEVD